MVQQGFSTYLHDTHMAHFNVVARDGMVPRTGSNLGTGSQPPEPEPNRFRTGSNNLLAEDDSVQNE